MADPVTQELLDKLETMADNSGVDFAPNCMITEMDYVYQTQMEMGNTHHQLSWRSRRSCL